MPALATTTTAEAGIALPPELLTDVLDLAAREDFRLWERQLARCGNCAHPIRLRGSIDHVNPHTGEVREVYSTDTEPAGVLLKACGNRRAAVCPGCAEVYRADAYQLIKAGLRGGKGVPDTVAAHPRVFATFTAPSFGPVHSPRRPCHPRRRAPVCPHGTRLDCRAYHQPDDLRLGEPLCVACYDYPAQVLWNALAPELWRRTRIYLDRTLARLAGLSVAALRRLVRVEYAKVAEYQARGVVHFHAVIRLDAATDDHTVQPPPAPFTLDLLEQAIRQAATRAAVPLPSIDQAARWGRQLDIRPITTGALDRSLSAEAVAGYIAKYATKATETFGTGLDRRLHHCDIDHLAARHLRPHIQAIVRACWQLGERADLHDLKLRRWAHMLGYRGHWTTRSRHYSTTFTALRAQRQAHARVRAQQSLGHDDREDQAAVIVLASWTYAGRGHRSEAERWLALAAAARAREHRRIAREERASAA